MEDVYADLNLEEIWNHLHVEGWMAVFQRWAAQDAFRRTWAISGSTYAERFRDFYDDRLAKPRLGRRPLTFPRSFIAAHRGRVDHLQLGNTINDGKASIRTGADVIELDVRKLDDGTLVLFHDEYVAGRAVKSMSYQALRSHFGQGREVPTLSECLVALGARKERRVLLDIELKDAGIEREVLFALASAAWNPADFVLTSFDENMLAEVRRLRHDVQVGLLIETTDLPVKAQAFMNSPDIDFIAPEGDRAKLTDSLLEELALAGMPVVPWTVNDEGLCKIFLSHPAVAGIITDELSLAQRVRSTIK
jgi:glycerophosphoryl diester phosphodiesterase